MQVETCGSIGARLKHGVIKVRLVHVSTVRSPFEIREYPSQFRTRECRSYIAGQKHGIGTYETRERRGWFKTQACRDQFTV